MKLKQKYDTIEKLKIWKDYGSLEWIEDRQIIIPKNYNKRGCLK